MLTIKFESVYIVIKDSKSERSKYGIYETSGHLPLKQ